ncbi:MAG TPA: SRPBCC family protein [Polyangiaceae bacterium]|jgi:uncharacterized protein YndB with AHSA1/START domain|nr:SRPBCC family protein [Polyangiaceae bacterium]
MRRVQVERVIAAPPADVFARYTDHAGWTAWAGTGKVSLAREGTPDPNGVGCVRAFESAMGLQEEVIEFDPPHHMAYRIARGGFPITAHRGDVRFEAHPRGTRVVWSVEFRSRIPLTERALAGFLRRMFTRLLTRFDERGMVGAA